MRKKLKLEKIFKCSVRNCSNLVHHKGAFCKSCIDKLTSDSYVINYCLYCGNIIDTVFIGEEKIPFEDRFHSFICPNCINQIDNFFDEQDE